MFYSFNSIQAKQREIHEHRESVLEKANERSLTLQQEYLFQEFKVEAQEVCVFSETIFPLFIGNHLLDVSQKSIYCPKLKEQRK